MRDLDVPDDAIVLRFTPTSPEAVLRRAEAAERLHGHKTLSVFVGEMGTLSREQVVEGLLRAAQMQGIDMNRNPVHFVCASARKIKELGFTFVKEDIDDVEEVDEHCSVNLGGSADLDDVARFLDVFERERRQA